MLHDVGHGCKTLLPELGIPDKHNIHSFQLNIIVTTLMYEGKQPKKSNLSLKHFLQTGIGTTIFHSPQSYEANHDVDFLGGELQLFLETQVICKNFKIKCIIWQFIGRFM
jgi:hypothetical protein